MKNWLLKVVMVWILIYLAFWLGSGLKYITDWEEWARYVMVLVMILSFIPLSIDSIESDKNNKK